MRRPDQIERMYLDFDGFFASVEQQVHPRLRGRPVGVVPYENAHTCIIACSKEAKAAGVKNVMMVGDAKRICPDIMLVPQSPDLYRRAHNALLSEIESCIPIDVVKSIDELSCILDATWQSAPHDLSVRIKQTIADAVGPYITCSMGFAANRHLAKIAGSTNKPDGLTIWHPKDMPQPLTVLPLGKIPGVGSRMATRLANAGVNDTAALLALAPKQMRGLWGNVTGERLWYALHGYAIEAPQTLRGMFGHARVLPPEERTLPKAREVARLLCIKATRRLRRSGYYAGTLSVWISLFDGAWARERTMPMVRDDQAILTTFSSLWAEAVRTLPKQARLIRVGVTLGNLTRAEFRQLDLFLRDDKERQKWERIGTALDDLNRRYGKTVASLGMWSPPKGGNVGGKISFTRIPSPEDFW